jgi:hypothetical protein
MQGGVLADKVDKRKALIITNLGSGISALHSWRFSYCESRRLLIMFTYLAILLGIFSAIECA